MRSLLIPSGIYNSYSCRAGAPFFGYALNPRTPSAALHCASLVASVGECPYEVSVTQESAYRHGDMITSNAAGHYIAPQAPYKGKPMGRLSRAALAARCNPLRVARGVTRGVPLETLLPLFWASTKYRVPVRLEYIEVVTSSTCILVTISIYIEF